MVAARDGAAVDQASLRRMVDVAAATVDVVIVHTPSSLDAGARWCVTTADVFVEVLALDVMSFRASTRLLARLSPDVEADRVRFVVNRAARAEVVPADVERVFGHAAGSRQPPVSAFPDRSGHRPLGRSGTRRSRRRSRCRVTAQRSAGPGVAW